MQWSTLIDVLKKIATFSQGNCRQLLMIIILQVTIFSFLFRPKILIIHVCHLKLIFQLLTVNLLNPDRDDEKAFDSNSIVGAGIGIEIDTPLCLIRFEQDA